MLRLHKHYSKVERVTRPGYSGELGEDDAASSDEEAATNGRARMTVGSGAAAPTAGAPSATALDGPVAFPASQVAEGVTRYVRPTHRTVSR